MSLKSNIVATVTVAALAVGGVAYANTCTPEPSSSPSPSTEVVVEESNEVDCLISNFEAKSSYWKDVLADTNNVNSLTVKEREALVADDMENAAQNMRDGSYRVCWGE